MEDFTAWKRIQRKLIDVSPTFCPNKWTQLLVQLQAGSNQSCCHSPPHFIPKSEIEASEWSYHQSEQLQKVRRSLLEGKKAKDCDYCWQVEALGRLSDRVKMTASDWSISEIDSIVSEPFKAQRGPTYLEVSFSNLCQMKCLYCRPEYSSAWAEETRNLGHPLGPEFTPPSESLKFNIDPIYAQAFWKWLPQIYPDLKVFRITGGEPLLHKELEQVIEFLSQNKNPNLTFALNSNLSLQGKPFDRLKSWLNQIEKSNLARIQLYASLDSWGPQAEYIRSGLNLETFRLNAQTYLQETTHELWITVTCSVLNAFGLTDLLRWVKDCKNQFESSDRRRIFLGFTFVNEPSYLHPALLPREHHGHFEGALDFMIQNPNCFSENEVEQLKTVIEVTRKGLPLDEYALKTSLLIKFLENTDLRRGTKVWTTFPELAKSFRKT